MQPVLVAVLVAAVVGSLIGLLATSLRQRRRRMYLARTASELGLRYSADDPFDIARRYADFALIASGHSPAAMNVIFGHLEGLAVRSFDFQYEVGHGTRRMTRRYGVILLELPEPPPRLLMWHKEDFPPVSAGQARQSLGAWGFWGDLDQARALAHATEPWFRDGGCIEISRNVVVLAAPGRGGLKVFPQALAEVVKAVRKSVVTESAGHALR